MWVVLIVFLSDHGDNIGVWGGNYESKKCKIDFKKLKEHECRRI